MGGITTMSQADGHDGLSRNGGARVSSNGRDLVARVRRVHPGRRAIAPAGAGVARVRRVVSRLKKGGGRRSSGGDSLRPRRPLRSGGLEPTCIECRRRSRWAGALWCEPCYVGLRIMDGTAGFSDTMARLGESAS